MTERPGESRRVAWLLGCDEPAKASPIVRPPVVPDPVVPQRPATVKQWSRKSSRTAIIDGSPWAVIREADRAVDAAKRAGLLAEVRAKLLGSTLV